MQFYFLHFQTLHDTVISGSYDGTVRIWSIRELMIEKFAETDDMSSSSMISSAPSLEHERTQGRNIQRTPSMYSDVTVTEENEIIQKRRTPSMQKSRQHSSFVDKSNLPVHEIYNSKTHKNIENYQTVPVTVHNHNTSNNNNNPSAFEQYDEAAEGLDKLLETEENNNVVKSESNSPETISDFGSTPTFTSEITAAKIRGNKR